MRRTIMTGIILILAFLLGVIVTANILESSGFTQGSEIPRASTAGSGKGSANGVATSSTGAVTNVIPGLDAMELNTIGIYQKLAPTVVYITAVRQYFTPFYGLVPDEGTGSGVVISSEGYILTNNHVVKDAGELTVRFMDGSVAAATLVGVDPFTDLAVIKVEQQITPEWVANLGDSDTLLVGQKAMAIGNPFGFDHTMSVGIISALGRPIKTQEAEYDDMIQTDASINPGNSGGPLINTAGEVIGINTGIFSKTGTSLGIGFAIPSNTCSKVAEDLIAFGRVRRAWLGASGFGLNNMLARELGLMVDRGLLIQSVTPGSPAYKAGLKVGNTSRRFRIGRNVLNIVLGGDIIVGIEGEAVFNQEQLDRTVKKMTPGDKVKLQVFRDGGVKNIEIELEIEP